MKKLISFCLAFVLAFTFVSSTSVVMAADAVVLGDLNEDGAVDMKDMYLMRLRLAKVIGNSDINKDNADVNVDGIINGIDALMIINHLAKEKVFGNVSTYTIGTISDNIKLHGRAVLQNSELLLSQTASGFEFIAECEGDIQIQVITASSGKLAAIIDENYDNPTLIDVKKNKTSYSFGLDLEKGEHSILISKPTEATHNPLYTIGSVTIVGNVKDTRPADKPLRIEFYGDSMTSGYGNLTYKGMSNAGSWEYEDGTRTYATFLAQKMNADYAIASASGHGILGGHSDFTSSYTKFFDYSLIETKTAWSRTDYDADLIILNYGQNDYERSKGSLGCDIVAFKAECKKIIEQFHSDNSDANIVWVLNMMSIAEDSEVHKAIEEACAAYDYVTFVRMPTSRQNGGDWHPSIEDHKLLAQDLLNILQGSVVPIY